MLAADEHENDIAHSLQITNAVASNRLTSASIADICAVMTTTSASIVGMSAAWKIGGAGRRCMFWEMQAFLDPIHQKTLLFNKHHLQQAKVQS